MYQLALFQSQFQRDLSHTWHRTAPSKIGGGQFAPSLSTPPVSSSSLPRRSSRSANQKRAAVPTHWAASLVQYVSVRLHSRKMKPPPSCLQNRTARDVASQERV